MPADRVSDSPPRRRRTDGARILIIEDSDDLRSLMEFALEEEGYYVDSARTAEEAMRLLESRRYVLVLSDYALPGRSGAWLLTEAIDRDLLHGAAARLVTAEPDSPGIPAAITVIAKPVDFEKFLPQVREVIAATLDAPASRDGGDADGVVDLVLYISPASVPSVRATLVMERVLRGYDTRRVRFTICDVAADPDRAAHDRVVFTPSLVRRSPLPRMWVLGDLTRHSVVVDLLAASGVPAAGL
jgi:CheY-like chemotaxis protein